MEAVDDLGGMGYPGQVYGLGGGVTLDCEHVIPVTQCGTWGHTGDCGRVKQAQCLWRGITLDTGNVTSVPWSRGCHTESCRHATPSAGSEKWGLLRDCERGTPGTGCWRQSHTVDCRHVAQVQSLQGGVTLGTLGM